MADNIELGHTPNKSSEDTDSSFDEEKHEETYEGVRIHETDTEQMQEVYEVRYVSRMENLKKYCKFFGPLLLLIVFNILYISSQEDCPYDYDTNPVL